MIDAVAVERQPSLPSAMRPSKSYVDALAEGGTRKGHRNGADRLVTPEVTLARLGDAMQVAGITRVANITGLDRVGVPVVAVCRPNTRSIAVAQGKGATLAAAKASGIMEAIEAHHAETVDLPLLRASYAELRGRKPMVDVMALPRLSVGQFDQHLRILWVEGRDLASGEEIWVPHEMVHTDFTLPLPAGSGCFLMSSNGLASGNHLLEATSHAICELVERDAVTLQSLSSDEERGSRRVDPTTVDDPLCRDILDKFERAELEVAIVDATSDVGLPVFRCDVADRENATLGVPMAPLRGTGCHPRRELALLRALTEAAQTRLTMISGARDDLSPWWYADQDRVAEARKAFFQKRQAWPARRHFHQAPTFEADTVIQDVRWQLQLLEAVGLGSPVLIDLTKADLGISVARVLVPGLEPMREAPGYTPGTRARRKVAGGRD